MELVIEHNVFFDSVCVGNSVLDENLWQITILVEAFEMFENQICVSLFQNVLLVNKTASLH